MNQCFCDGRLTYANGGEHWGANSETGCMAGFFDSLRFGGTL